jgi:hypothetical protein
VALVIAPLLVRAHEELPEPALPVLDVQVDQSIVPPSPVE